MSLDLSKFDFPKVTKLDMAFSTLKIIPELLAEAERRDPTIGVAKFNQLFFEGGEIKLKPDVEGTWKEGAYLYAKALMSSWEPKHQHKELVCGMIFEECLVLDDDRGWLGKLRDRILDELKIPRGK